MVAVEIAVQDLAGVLAARDAGADRVELCVGLVTGGLTPPAGLLAAAVESGLPVHPLIRTRTGGFVHDPLELDVLVRDVRAAVRAGAAGVVVGALRPDGELDEDAVRALVDAAGGARVTFHRAFDVVPDRARAVDRLAALGVARVLTSGGAATAPQGSTELARSSRHVRGTGAGVEVMAGGGVARCPTSPRSSRPAWTPCTCRPGARVTTAGRPGPGGGAPGFDVTDPEVVRAASPQRPGVPVRRVPPAARRSDGRTPRHRPRLRTRLGATRPAGRVTMVATARVATATATATATGTATGATADREGCGDAGCGGARGRVRAGAGGGARDARRALGARTSRTGRTAGATPWAGSSGTSPACRTTTSRTRSAASRSGRRRPGPSGSACRWTPRTPATGTRPSRSRPSGRTPSCSLGYLEAVHAQTAEHLSAVTDPDLDRVVDTSYDPPVTLGVRLVSVLADDLQHAGQAAYVRGILAPLTRPFDLAGTSGRWHGGAAGRRRNRPAVRRAPPIRLTARPAARATPPPARSTTPRTPTSVQPCAQ